MNKFKTLQYIALKMRDMASIEINKNFRDVDQEQMESLIFSLFNFGCECQQEIIKELYGYNIKDQPVEKEND
jgi:hypothetical protein